ncbi:MAG: hypothetical protein HZB53_04715 [Chloroflexi bacterium]|nr:hypothetical protein [Chloroflexota bacterium]
MTLDNPLVGWGAAALAAVLTFGMPVNPRRVNQGLINILICVLSLVAAFALLEGATALLVGIGAAVMAIVLRDIARFVRHAMYDVTKYTRRDYRYRRVGQSLLSGGRRSRRH